MKFIYRISLAALFSAATFYCSGKTNIQIATAGSEIKAPAEANNVQAQVLADIGATLSIEKSVQLTIPAGALDQDTLISIDKKSVAAAQGILVPVAKSLELGAHGTQFSKSVALNVCYDPQTLAKQNLYEDTLAVYYVDPQTGEYGSVGGAVNKTTHCVSANIEHFSTYLVAAQNLSLNLTPAEQLPQISVTYVPGTPIAGLPVKVRAAITDFKLTPVSNGSGVQVGFGQIATVRYCYYAAPAVTCSGGLQNLAPDYDDEANNFYSFTIPGNQVNAQGFTVLYEVYNSLGFKRTRTVNYVPTRTATGIQFTSNAVVNLAAGFKRSYTIQGLSDVGAPQNIPIDSFILNGGIGTAVKTSASVIRVTGTTANPQAMRTGSLTVTAGAFNITSPDINVHAGLLDHIALLSPTGVVLGNSINVNANATYDFDVLGYDAFGNTSNVLPQFVLVPLTGAGTITSTGLYTAPATVQTATLVATLNGVMVSILINVQVPAPTGLIGQPDPSFGGPNVGSTIPTLNEGQAAGVAVDTADNSYVSGYQKDINGIKHMIVYKFNSTGAVVSGFGSSGVFTDAAAEESVGSGIIVDASGNILVTGYKYDVNFTKQTVVWRVLPNGTLDTNFAGSGMYTLPAMSGGFGKSLALDSAGRILVTARSDDEVVLFRLTTAGLLDTSFAVSGIVTAPSLFPGDEPAGIRLNAAGEIFVSGWYLLSPNSGNYYTDAAIWKFTSAGAVDTSFGNSGVFHYGDINEREIGYDFVIEPSGRMLLAGIDFVPSGLKAFVVAVNSNGTLDTTYGTNGAFILNPASGSTAFAIGTQLDSSGRLIVTGPDFTAGASAWRLTPAGALDLTFAFGTGRATFGSLPYFLGQCVLDSQGRIVSAGYIPQNSGGYLVDTLVVLRYN